MRHLKTSALLVAAISFAFTACDKKSADTGSGNSAKPGAMDEKTALANFKTEAEAFAKWAEEKGKAAATDPATGLAMFGELSAKFKTVKTDGLPADLKSAWADMGNMLDEMATLFKDVKLPPAGAKPEDAAKLMAEMGPKMQEIMPKMQAIQAKGEPIAKKLEEVGKKYGLDMKNVGSGK